MLLDKDILTIHAILRYAEYNIDNKSITLKEIFYCTSQDLN